MSGHKPWDVWIAQYAESHQHPLNRLTHMLGIPMILCSLPVLLAAIAWHRLLCIGGVLFGLGWALQFLGHALEGKLPEFFHDWRFLLVGSRWWFTKLRRKI